MINRPIDSVAHLETILLPDIGDFAEVEVVEILVAPGDRIEAEQSILTLESDKATMEIPSPRAGVVEDIAVQLGDRLSKGDLILTLRPEASRIARVQTPRVGAAPGRKAQGSPTVRRLARELGVDLIKVRGSGPKGRVLKEDVQGSVPQATQFDEADITELEDFRRSHKDAAAAEGVKLTFLPFLLKAVATALGRHPAAGAMSLGWFAVHHPRAVCRPWIERPDQSRRLRSVRDDPYRLGHPSRPRGGLRGPAALGQRTARPGQATGLCPGLRQDTPSTSWHPGAAP